MQVFLCLCSITPSSDAIKKLLKLVLKTLDRCLFGIFAVIFSNSRYSSQQQRPGKSSGLCCRPSWSRLQVQAWTFSAAIIDNLLKNAIFLLP